ncbi:hypothetical protein HRE53_32645 (plasmid) [Acaryochloris sp. 'Moss Beach']|nr:hypothetical protein HRE53_32645 [Acaryochloris sp. 'Moss Beach']
MFLSRHDAVSWCVWILDRLHKTLISLPKGEVENTLDEFKTHLNGRKTPIRSKNPREVVQEVYGWLLAHWAVRCLMFQAAEHGEISPLNIGFTGTLKVLRRAVPTFQATPPKELPFFSVG